jgi:hypothetical protein
MNQKLLKTGMSLGLAAILLTVAAQATTKTVKAKKTPTPVPVKVNKTAVMNKALKFWVYEKGGEFIADVGGIFDPKMKKMVIKCGLMNMTKKDIRGVRGVVRFTTLFGEHVGDISLETTAAVPAGQRIAIEWKAGADRFTPEGLKKFEKLKLEEMKQIWVPRMIVFTDGTTLQQ